MSGSMWVVSQGDYSDYRVLCVYDSKARAEQVRDTYNRSGTVYSEAEIEELAYVSAPPRRVRTYRISEHIYDSGKTKEYRESYEDEWDWEIPRELTRSPVTMRWVRAPMFGGKGGRLDMSGTDEIKLKKVFSEIRARLLLDDEFRGRELME